MPTNNFKPFGIGSGANVTDQTAYEALASLLTGFQSGKASSAQINKALRQGTVMANVLAQFIANKSGNDVLDNGDTATIITNLIAALKANGANDFLQKANNLSEIQSAGTTAQGSARTNLGLGSASTRGIGTGSSMVPDMSSFSSGVGSNAWWYKHPSGVIEQYGLVSNMSSTGITIPYPIAFPNEFRSFQIGATGNSGANNYTIATLSLNPATGTKQTHFTVTGYNTSTSSAGTPNNSTLANVIFYWRATGA